MRLFELVAMDITHRKRDGTVTLSEHLSVTENIAATVRVSKSSVSRIINTQKVFGTVSPKQKGNDRINLRRHHGQTNLFYEILKYIPATQVQIFRKIY